MTIQSMFGFGALVCWGVADYFSAQAVRFSDVFKALFWPDFFALIMMVFCIPFGVQLVLPSARNMLLLVFAICIYLVATYAFTVGLKVGKLCIVNPISSAWGLITVLLSVAFLNETVTGIHSIGILLTTGGTMLLSFSYHELVHLKTKNIVKGAEYGFIAMFGWGINVFLLTFLVREIGWFLPSMYLKLGAVPLFFGISRFKKKSLQIKGGKLYLFLIFAGLLNTLGFLLYSLGVEEGYASVVAPIATAYPAVTVIMAYLLLKERFEINQLFGFIALLIGLVILAI
ncbi:MAG: DMT family transporter [Candidatus Woesearchaeota archaeon]